jgi:hypothetical protein
MFRPEKKETEETKDDDDDRWCVRRGERVSPESELAGRARRPPPFTGLSLFPILPKNTHMCVLCLFQMKQLG